MSLPEGVIEGEPVRLFPIVSDSSREKRVLSITLSTATALPEFAALILARCGQRVGKQSRLTVFTEIVFKKDTPGKLRPDALLIFETGKSTWRALIEAKIGKSEIRSEQVESYLEVAHANGIDAVITISNQLVSSDHHLTFEVNKKAAKNIGIFHLSWSWIKTQAIILKRSEKIENPERRFLLDHYIDYLNHPTTGIEGFRQMPKNWTDLLSDIRRDVRLRKTGANEIAVVAAWQQEARDIELQLSELLGCDVRQRMERKYKSKSEEWHSQGCKLLAENCVLSANYIVPNAASDLSVTIDLTSRSCRCSAWLSAPEDRKSTKARVNWLLRQLSETEWNDVYVEAYWPGRAPKTSASLSDLREKPEAIQGENQSLTPLSFTVAVASNLNGNFSRPQKFVVELERLVPRFYDEILGNLRAWVRPPPKPLDHDENTDSDGVNNEARRV